MVYELLCEEIKLLTHKNKQLENELKCDAIRNRTVGMTLLEFAELFLPEYEIYLKNRKNKEMISFNKLNSI